MYSGDHFRSAQPCIPLGSLNRVPALAGQSQGGNVSSAGWQVTLCDPMWHVSSHSGVATLQTAIRLLLTYLLAVGMYGVVGAGINLTNTDIICRRCRISFIVNFTLSLLHWIPLDSRLATSYQCRLNYTGIAVRNIIIARWLGSRVVSMLDSGAEGPRFKSQPRRCWVTVLGKLFTPIHQAAKLVASLLRVARVTAGLAESNGSLPPGLWLMSPAGWLPRTGISSGTLRSVIEYGLPLPF